MRPDAPTLVVVILAAALVAPSVAAGQGHAVATDGCWGLLFPPADEPTGGTACPPAVDGQPFRAGTFGLEFMTGYFPRADVGPHGAPQLTPALDYLPQAIRLGLMCNDPVHDWCLPVGVCEVLLEYEYAPIVRTFGHYLTGPSALLRYNLPLPDCALVPYGQLGAGFVFTDAWKDPVQHLIGQEFEFLLRAEAGVHIMVGDRWSLNVEGGFQHISNANLAPRNDGLNSFGVAIGLTRYFGK